VAIVYYPLVVSLGFAPWTLYLVMAVESRAAASRSRNAPDGILMPWVVVPLVGFTLAATKLPHYILPIWPALSLVSGRAAERELGGGVRPTRLRSVAIALLAAIVGGEAAALVIAARVVATEGLVQVADIAALLLAAGFAAALFACARQRARAALLLTIAAVATNVTWAAFAVAPALDRAKIGPGLAAVIRGSAAPVYAFEFAEPSLVFYGGRHVSEIVGEQKLIEWASRSGEALLITPRESVAAVERVHGTLGLREIASRRGWNYVKGRRLEVVAFVRSGAR
jgi:4-amino-4-deoxy-L-arabinose transferase-like glycosyltransferase